MHSIKALLGEEGKHIAVISKIENKEGIDNVDEIIEARLVLIHSSNIYLAVLELRKSSVPMK